MCWCNSQIRTPNCRRIGCVPPTSAVSEQSIGKLIDRIFVLGQVYWQQADSESYTQNKKSDETHEKFQSAKSELLELIAMQARKQGGE